MSGADITYGEIVAAIRAAGVDAPITVEQTGGGVATVCIGTLTDVEYCEAMRGPDQHYTALIGPGVFNWGNPDASLFYSEELMVGPDDHGESGGGTQALSLTQMAEAVRMLVQS